VLEQALVDGRSFDESGNNNTAELNDSEINSIDRPRQAEPDAQKAADIRAHINSKVIDTATHSSADARLRYAR
jgi:hypothetical protein